ncbi:hypothetical protein N0V90_006863 [Kalmusia sp. IMI 367209]|nr:hypothetical protein N0V90_006863 [Kalmusia sp. IMI 367209]
MTLSYLPLELLQQIADCVETVHWPSLYAFSLTSKDCHRASAFLIFRQINIKINHPEGLRRNADRLVEALSRTDSACHVQCISIKGALRLSAKKTNSGDQDTNWLRRFGLDEILVDEELVRYGDPYVVYDEPVIEKSSEEDMAWAPVVSLLQTIPYLEDLVYDCQSQFPPSLLSTLREQHPQCRLHHLTFRFRTLLWGVPYPYEMELATFPSLYRVKVACALRDTDGDDDFNLEAIMEVVAGLAPNLKEVIILNLFPSLSSRYRRSRESWQGLPGFTGEVHLALGGGYNARTSALSGETMKWVAQNHSFPRVKTLSVYLTRDDMYHERPHYSENAVSFFQAFESLEELSVRGPIDSHIIHGILYHHGQKLKKLGFHPFEESVNVTGDRDRRYIPIEFTKDHILQIQAQFPVLEELAIPVKRNKSSASEAEMYKCFAGMKCLRFLFINLDCSSWRVFRDSTYRPQFDEEDQKPVDYPIPLSKGILKETFINCAVDETLARSIWKAISQNKTGRQLDRLKLWTTGGGEYGGGPTLGRVSTIIQSLSRSWLIERVPQDDQENITVRELGQHARNVSDPQARYSHESEAGQIFRTIWLCKEGSKDWRDDWASFPLQA